MIVYHCDSCRTPLCGEPAARILIKASPSDSTALVGAAAVIAHRVLDFCVRCHEGLMARTDVERLARLAYIICGGRDQ